MAGIERRRRRDVRARGARGREGEGRGRARKQTGPPREPRSSRPLTAGLLRLPGRAGGDYSPASAPLPRRPEAAPRPLPRRHRRAWGPTERLRAGGGGPDTAPGRGTPRREGGGEREGIGQGPREVNGTPARFRTPTGARRGRRGLFTVPVLRARPPVFLRRGTPEATRRPLGPLGPRAGGNNTTPPWGPQATVSRENPFGSPSTLWTRSYLPLFWVGPKI